jgi:hypothetical protein
MRFSILFALAILGLSSCLTKSGNTATNPAVPDSIIIDLKILEKDFRPSGKENLLNLRLVSIALAPQDSATQAIAQHFNQAALNLSAHSNLVYQSTEQRADSLIAELNRNLERPDFLAPWELNQSLEVVLHKNGKLGLNLRQKSFLGGAHANRYSQYFYYRLRDGAVLDLTDLIPNLDTTLFLAGAERAFRQQLKIDPNTSLQEAGFWFKKNRFTLAQNFYFDGDSLALIYNPYEIAPYAKGKMVIGIPPKYWRKTANSKVPQT